MSASGGVVSGKSVRVESSASKIGSFCHHSVIT